MGAKLWIHFVCVIYLCLLILYWWFRQFRYEFFNTILYKLLTQFREIFTEKGSYSGLSHQFCMSYWHSWRYIYGKRVILWFINTILHELLRQLGIYLRKQGHTLVYQHNFAWEININKKLGTASFWGILGTASFYKGILWDRHFWWNLGQLVFGEYLGQLVFTRVFYGTGIFGETWDS